MIVKYDIKYNSLDLVPEIGRVWVLHNSVLKRSIFSSNNYERVFRTAVTVPSWTVLLYFQGVM